MIDIRYLHVIWAPPEKSHLNVLHLKVGLKRRLILTRRNVGSRNAGGLQVSHKGMADDVYLAHTY